MPSTASGPRLYLVEDDPTARESVALALTETGYVVAARETGSEVDQVLELFRPDLAIIDVNLPSGPNGFEVAQEIRMKAGVPVLFLTAADSIEDRLRGFDAGGDDYLVKPFDLAELLARVRAILRRSGRLGSAVLEVRDLVIDQQAKVVVRGDKQLPLTSTEFELLCTFARSPGTVFSKLQLLSLVWGFDSYDPNVVEVHMSSLRKKMEALGPRLIHTERNHGYVLRA